MSLSKNSNTLENETLIKRSSVIEIKLGAGRKSFSGRFSAKPTKSVSRSKSIKRAFIASAEKTIALKGFFK